MLAQLRRTYVIEVGDLNYEVISDLRGCLEAAMASEDSKTAVRGNMHMKGDGGW